MNRCPGRILMLYWPITMIRNGVSRCNDERHSSPSHGGHAMRAELADGLKKRGRSAGVE